MADHDVPLRFQRPDISSALWGPTVRFADEEATPVGSRDSRSRLGLVAITALSLFGALFARLWVLQIVEGDDLAAKVDSNAIREVVLPAQRGRILDRNQVVLVDNRPSTIISIDRQQFDDLDRPEQSRILERVVTFLNRYLTPSEALTVKSVRQRLEDVRFSPFRPIPIADDVTVDEEIYFREQADRFPSVVVEHKTVREYPYGSLAAHVLGYVGGITEEQFASLAKSETPKPYTKSDEIGKAGVEKRYERYLKGTPGRAVYEVDASNRVVREITSERIDPIPGDDVHLALDARIQYKTEEALQAQIIASKTPTPAGAATVIDPRNGQILAMASYPTYDPSALVGGISQKEYDALTDPKTKILSNRAIQEAYPAASTFKLATSYAGLKLGLITPGLVVNDQGTYELCTSDTTGCKKRNSGGGKAMGPITLSTALARSSDFYYYKLGHEAWLRHTQGNAAEDLLQREITTLGYGARTGVDLTAESAGRVPTPQSNRDLADSLWKADHANYRDDKASYEDARRWKAGFNADVAIGQFDTLVTPLQTANAYASLANPNGILYHPSVLGYVSPTGEPTTVLRSYKPAEIRRVDYGSARPALLEGLTGVTHNPSGTAYNVFRSFPLDTFSVAGKTGTAEVGDEANQRTDNSLFVGFGPTEDPQYVVSVMIEGGGFGANAAAPAAWMIFKPIASGDLESFEVPLGAPIDVPGAAAAATSSISAIGTD